MKAAGASEGVGRETCVIAEALDTEKLPLRWYSAAVRCMLSVGRKVDNGNSGSSVVCSVPFNQLMRSRPSGDTNAQDKSGRDTKLV